MDRLAAELGKREPGTWVPRRWWILLAILTVAAVVLAFASRDPSAAVGDWVQVSRGDLEERALGVGELVASGQQVVVAAEAGVVLSVEKGLGDALDAGDTIIVLSSPQLALEQEAAQIEARRQSLEAEESLLRTEQEVERASLALAQAESAETVAQAELRMNRELAERGIASRISLDQAEARAHQHALATRSAARLLALVRDQQARQVQSRRESSSLARLHTERLDTRVNALQVRATSAGVIKAIDARVGDSIGAGQVLAVVGPPVPDRARVRFPQRYAAKLTPGQEVELVLLDQRTVGRIDRVAADLSAGQITVEILLAEVPASARIDMAVRAEALLAVHRDVLFVRTPLEPVLSDGNLRTQVRPRLADSNERPAVIRGVRPVDGALLLGDGASEGEWIRLDGRF